MPKLPRRQLPLQPLHPYPPAPQPWKPLGLHPFPPPPQELPVSLKPPKPSKASRNQRKQEARRLLAQQQRPQQANPLRLEEVAYKRLG